MLLAKIKTPIIDALQKYSTSNTVRFHMPGHKGRGVSRILTRLLGKKVFAADITNVPGMDDLHHTHGVIKEAQALAARTFGADFTYFLINGSSCGLQAIILTVCNPGDKILVPRNLHRSILSGIILSGAVPVFFLPDYDSYFGIPLGTSPEIIEKALIANPETKAVLLVNPTYHGIVSDIQTISEIVHSFNIPFIVDEAHGPHLGFSNDLPLSSLRLGADGVVHGTHKILTAFTQASMLHIRGTRIDRQRLEAVLKVLQSTSTSYLLLASLDAAAAEMALNGRNLVNRAIAHANYLRESIGNNFSLPVLGKKNLESLNYELDPTKVTISVRELQLTGFWAEQWLREHYNIQVEMSDIFNLLLIIGPGTSQDDMDYFLTALRKLHEYTQKNLELIRGQPLRCDFLPEIPEMVIGPRDAFFAETVSLPLEQAIGKVSGETIACYPPGIPVICPGERITNDVINYVMVMRDMGVHMQGCSDPELKTIAVLKGF